MRPVALWNPARDVWEVPETENLLCEHLAVFSATFPTSGMTRAGTAYVLPTSAPLTDGCGSSLLPTPSVADGMGGHLTRSGDRSGELLLPGVAKALYCPPRPPATPTDPEPTETAG